ncbi:MAG: helix-turn-helix transcriptional regulator [Pseudomonadota bacterium]
MENTFLSWYQGMQLFALGPCLFVILFLCIIAGNFSKIVIPLLYFISLSSGFLLPLSEIFGITGKTLYFLMLIDSMTTPLSFLLIIEFTLGSITPLIYWAILALPLIGGSSVIYLNLYTASEVCVYKHLCASPEIFRRLYEIFSGALTLLLTIVVYNRLGQSFIKRDTKDNHKHAVIISLIVLNIVIIAIKLMQISSNVVGHNAEIAITVTRIGFIYIVLTSIFRIFDNTFEIVYERVAIINQKPISIERENQIVEEIKKMMGSEKIYRNMELNREILAKKLAVTENCLSRVINQSFKMNFNMLINKYRVEEAKILLKKEEIAITTLAFNVGFSSIPSFNRVFKQLTNLSPTEYRNQNKG